MALATLDNLDNVDTAPTTLDNALIQLTIKNFHFQDLTEELDFIIDHIDECEDIKELSRIAMKLRDIGLWRVQKANTKIDPFIENVIDLQFVIKDYSRALKNTYRKITNIYEGQESTPESEPQISEQ